LAVPDRSGLDLHRFRLGELPLTAQPRWSAPAPPPRDDRGAAASPLALLEDLAAALAAAGVTYCQWKGHFKRERWGQGVGDVDLLVERRSAARFVGVLSDLGFKLAVPPAEQQLPGVLSYLGLDPATQRLVHVHVHYRLVIGSYWRTTYRVPLERVVLESTRASDVFRTPAAELELLLFVLRQVQRFTLRDALRAPRWLAGIQAELADLVGSGDGGRLRQHLAQHLPAVDTAFFERALASLAPDAPAWRRPLLRRELHRRFRAHARAPLPLTRLTVLVREIVTLRGRLGASMSSKHLGTGGGVIALAGSDGAGKSTCARELVAWLAPHFRTAHAHLGKPPRSLATLLVGGALKAAQVIEPWVSTPATYLDQLRCVATARDRYRLYEKVRRIVRDGALAVCERYPIREDSLFAGPSIARDLPPGPPSALTRLLMRVERRYYQQMVSPNLLLVLRVDPVTAVRRKTTEPADYVRDRAHASGAVDWAQTNARVVDAARPLADVLAELKAYIWAEI
jgi:thymidylate kinase